VRVLLDESVPRRFAHLILGHEVATVVDHGWAGLRNGEPLDRASGEFDVFVTVDKNLPRPRTGTIHHEMANVVNRSRLDRQGRLVIPARVRAAAGLAPGSALAVRVSHGRVIVEPLEAIERKMWRAAARAKAGDATSELLADRRREAERDSSS